MSESNATRRPLTLDDLAALRGVSDPQISPDGRQVAFVVETLRPETNELRSQIWLVDADVDAAPRPLTAGDKQDSQPRWSPDGQRLAFVSNRTGTAQLWLLPLDGGEA
ncbi:MAG TPA: S9 family peptidase, partial [Chloroflexota bacterium]